MVIPYFQEIMKLINYIEFKKLLEILLKNNKMHLIKFKDFKELKYHNQLIIKIIILKTDI